MPVFLFLHFFFRLSVLSAPSSAFFFFFFFPLSLFPSLVPFLLSFFFDFSLSRTFYVSETVWASLLSMWRHLEKYFHFKVFVRLFVRIGRSLSLSLSISLDSRA